MITPLPAGKPAMPPVQNDLVNDGRAFFSTGCASGRERWLALAAVLGSAALFLAAVPLATKQLVHVPAFIPAYESALVICDLITAVLLFGQFNVLRSRALFALASSYLFTAFFAFAHALSFPGVFAPAGLLGGGSQTTAWLYMIWHGGFPLFVIAYALLKDPGQNALAGAGADSQPRSGTGSAISAAVVSTGALVIGLTIAATANHESLPALIIDNRFTSSMTAVVSGVWALSLAALVVLWRRRPHTALDVWLMVVMCASLFDVALSAVFNAGRFDLGWYAGRIYGLLAASFLLIVLLIENGRNYARLAQLSLALRSANKSLQELSLHDGLTGLANRRFFDIYFAKEIALARRHQRTLALVLCDVDAFKGYNDHYGHQAGDECLKRVAIAIQSCCRRPADMAVRYGGEEFALVLPDTESDGAVLIAEAMRHAVATLKIPHAYSPAAPHVSISGGVAILNQKAGMTAQQLVAAADRTLYQAKDQGRNRMVSAQAEHL